MGNCCKNENCNCADQNCPNRGNCVACIKAHIQAGTLVYCMQEIANKQ
ncbi:hypothetical protein [Methanococcus maripaludis]|uniref:Uncharacterized protein n=2 Tax=Methanococcus maripaludis TaxID=39152 RepID=A0A7J9RZX6_METMI|nr:hypothetical protein [Methanococcus maripaludis]AEK19678.1 hypothetical protein GYY_04015 [Methanococcus maripaludis X1]MBB6067589.1 hypothetical protein [Methanococcus maripaludis]MBG0769720.1 hypothetical protein [Methanococcus maripaludis]